MRCRRTKLILTLCIWGFASSFLLVAYTIFSSLRGRLIKPLQENHVDNNHPNVTVSRLLENLTGVSHPSLPLIDFNDLGTNKTNVLLLLIVGSAPQGLIRRQAIRGTWWRHCSDPQVKCVFMTDGFIQDHFQRNLTMQEIDKYKDIGLLPLSQGLQFGYRFLYHIKWAMAKFNFQYLLRIDDDYFLCLKRLLSELPSRPREKLVWGSYHCEAGITWVDEGFMIFSKDVIQKFLAQNKSTMLCHPFGDQQIALWLQGIPNQTFFHDTRIHHHPPASFVPKFNNITSVCDSYLGVHGAYNEKMWYLGMNANDTGKNVSAIPDFSRYCKTRRFDYRVFSPRFRFELKPCKDNHTWVTDRKIYPGRENH